MLLEVCVAGLLAESECIPGGSCSTGELPKNRKRRSENPFAKLFDLSIRKERPEWPASAYKFSAVALSRK